MEITLFGVLVTSIFAYLVYFLLSAFVLKTWNHFTDRGVPFDRGVPVLGTFARVMLGRQPMAEALTDFYERYSKHKFLGFYQMGGIPTYMLRDIALIKKITVKDFDHFVNHGFNIDDKLDPLLGRNLFNMSNEKWRNMRSVLSPLFTGSKMRVMLSLMNETIDQFVQNLREDVSQTTAKAKEYNLLDLFTCSTNDAIASCAFGFKVDSFREPTNEFYKLGRQMAYVLQTPRFFVTLAFPKLCRLLNITVATKEQNNFFRNVVHETVEYRKKNNIVRNDMLHLMTLMREGKLDSINEDEKDQDAGFATISEILTAKATEKLKDFNDDDIVAQCVIFFLAGFTGIANSLCFLCYELATNPEAQDRLAAEVDEVGYALGNRPISYETLQKMKYLDCAITETLRKWSVNLFVERETTKQYLLDDGEGTKVVVEPGESIWMPAFAIQRDPKYYPEPEKFRPERFFADAQPPVDPDTYLPFGAGPRACIASRFALMQLKATAFHLIKAFRVECGPNAQVPLKLRPAVATLEVESFMFQLKIRNPK